MVAARLQREAKAKAARLQREAEAEAEDEGVRGRQGPRQGGARRHRRQVEMSQRRQRAEVRAAAPDRRAQNFKEQMVLRMDEMFGFEDKQRSANDNNVLKSKLLQRIVGPNTSRS